MSGELFSAENSATEASRRGGQARTERKLRALARLRAVRAWQVAMRRLNRRVPEGYRSLDHFLREILAVTKWPGLSQADLARHLDCDPKNVWRWLVARQQVPDDVTISEMENWRLKKLAEARKRTNK